MSDTQITFTDAVPVKRPKSGGNPAAPNPFTDIVKDIALKTYTKDTAPKPEYDGSPVTKKFIHVHVNADSVKTDRARIGRQIRAAAAGNTPKATARVVFEDANDEVQVKPGQPKTTRYRSLVTFWTVPAYAPKGKKTDEKTSE